MLGKLTRIGTIVLLAGLVASCSKSSSPTSGGTAPVLKAPTFAGPSTTSASSDTSIGAQTSISAAALFNATASGYLGFYTGAGSQSGNTWTWAYSVQGFTATWTATSSSSGYNWKLVYNGTLASNGSSTTFSNWTVINGSESSDGKTGSWTIYYPNTATVAYQVSWSTDASGTLTGTIVANDTTGTLQAKYVFTNKTDKSGELKYYTGTVLTLDATWTSSGSGQYTEWDDTGTTVIASGTWS